MLTPVEKRSYLKELAESEVFKGQVQLEQELMADLSKRLGELDLSSPAFHLEYAKLRGGLECLKSMQGVRNNLVNSAITSR